MNKIIEKSKMVVSDRKKVKQTIINKMFENLENLIESIENDISNIDDIKKKESLTKSKNTIRKIVEELLLLENIEDIGTVRRKLNYHITKIKKELQNRNIEIDDYVTNVNLFRDDITEYVRCFKRNNNIDIISNYDYMHISKESKKEMNKFINREKDFNKRIEDKYSNPREKKIDEKKSKKIVIKEVNEIIPIESQINKANNEIKKDNDAIRKAVLNNRMINLINNYKLVRTNEYNGKFIRNLIKFIGNIPKYMHNKKKLKLMKNDYLNYYSGKDLFKLISMTKYNNSFKYALGSLFKKDESSKFYIYGKTLSNLFDIIDMKNNVEYSSDDFNYESLKPKVLSR